MWEQIRSRVEDAARRSGLQGVPPAVLVILGALGLCAVIWAGVRWWPRADDAGLLVAEDAQAADAPGATTSASGDGVERSQDASLPGVIVHVVGAVRNPGVYTLSAGSRVNDAVGAAGGTMPEALLAQVNLARVLTDGEQVLIPDADDPLPAGAPAGAPSGGAPGGAPALVDINTADAAGLDTLPGVGPSTAAKIIAEREANGPFASVDDLTRVTGIGEKKLDSLRDMVCVR